jgi:hypothetical protein
MLELIIQERQLEDLPKKLIGVKGHHALRDETYPILKFVE